MWQTKYASAVPKNLGLGFDFWPCSEGDFLTGLPQSVDMNIKIRLHTDSGLIVNEFPMQNPSICIQLLNVWVDFNQIFLKIFKAIKKCHLGTYYQTNNFFFVKQQHLFYQNRLDERKKKNVRNILWSRKTFKRKWSLYIISLL